jgi:hypothetical protein
MSASRDNVRESECLDAAITLVGTTVLMKSTHPLVTEPWAFENPGTMGFFHALLFYVSVGLTLYASFQVELTNESLIAGLLPLLFLVIMVTPSIYF